MSTITKTDTDTTVQIFDNFYNYGLTINIDQWEVINSYFVSVTTSEEEANNFATFLFKIAEVTDTDVMELFATFNGKTKIQANQLMAYYFNSIRSKLVLVGITQIPTPNAQVQRNILL